MFEKKIRVKFYWNDKDNKETDLRDYTIKGNGNATQESTYEERYILYLIIPLC